MGSLVSFDFAIKYLLKDKSNYDIIEGFVSAVLKTQGYKPVKIIALLDTESNKEEYSQKKSLADLIVEDTDHQKYIIEIERQEAKTFVHKSCFNTSRLIADQVPSGEDYCKIKKIFHISILYFGVGDGPIYHGQTIIRELETQQKLSVHIENETKTATYDATNIFPEYIFISVPNFDNKIRKEIDEWLYVMKNDEVKPEFKSPYMEKVAEKLSVLKMTTEMRNEYINYRKQVATFKDAVDTAEERGEKRGLKKGEKIGMEKGEKRGIEKRNIQLAQDMLAKNMDIKIIEELTGLSINKIKELETT